MIWHIFWKQSEKNFLRLSHHSILFILLYLVINVQTYIYYNTWRPFKTMNLLKVIFTRKCWNTFYYLQPSQLVILFHLIILNQNILLEYSCWETFPGSVYCKDIFLIGLWWKIFVRFFCEQECKSRRIEGCVGYCKKNNTYMVNADFIIY